MNRDLHGGRYPQSVVMNMEDEGDSYEGGSADNESANQHQSSMMSEDYPPGRPDHEVKFALNRIIRILKLDRFHLLAEFHKNTDLVFTGVAAIASLIPKSFEKRSKNHNFDTNFSEIDYFGHLSTDELERHAIEILQGVINFQQTLTAPIIVELEGKNKIKKHFVEDWIQGVQEKFFKILSLTSSPEIICRLLYLKISTDSPDNLEAAKDDLAVYGDFLDALVEIDWQKLIVEFPDCTDKSAKTRTQALKLLNLPKDFQKVIIKLTEAEFDQYIDKKLDVNVDKNNKSLLKRKVKGGAKEEQVKESIKLLNHAYNLMISLFYSGLPQQEALNKLTSLSALATIAKMSLNASINNNSKAKGQNALDKSKKANTDSELKTARELLKAFFSIDHPHDAIGDLVANATGIIMSKFEKKSGTKKKKAAKTLPPIAKYLIDEVNDSLSSFQESYKSHQTKTKEGFPKTVYRFLNANMRILKLYIEKLPQKQRSATLLAKTKEVLNQYIDSIRFEVPTNDEVAQLFVDTIECLSAFTVINQLGSEWAVLALNKAFLKLLSSIVDWSKKQELTGKITLGLSSQTFFMKLAEEFFNLIQRLHKFWKSSFDPAKVAQVLFSEGLEKLVEESVKIPQVRGRVGVLVADLFNKLENSKQKKGKEQFHFTQEQEGPLRNITINILKHFDMKSVNQLIRVERFDSVTFLLSRLSPDEILLYVMRICNIFANSSMSSIDPISSGNCYLNYLPKFYTAVFPIADKKNVWHDLLYKLIEMSNKLIDEGQEALTNELERVNDPNLEEKKVSISNNLSRKISSGLWFVLSALSPKSVKKHNKLTKELFMSIFDLIDHQIKLLSGILHYTKKVTKISFLKAERLLQSYDHKIQHTVEYLVSLVKDSAASNNPKSIPNVTSKDRTIALNKLVNIYEFFCMLRVELFHLNDLEEVHKLPTRKVKNLFVTSILSLLRSDKGIELSDSLALRVLRSVQPILLKANTKNPIIESVNRALSPLWEEYFQNLTEIVFRLVDKKNLQRINDLLNDYGKGYKESEDYMLSQDWSIETRSEMSNKIIEETPTFDLRTKLGLDLEFYEFLFNKILEYLQNDKPKEIIALSSLLVTIRELAAKDPNTKVIFFLFADKITTIFRLLLSECSREHTDHSFFKVILTVKTIILSSINSSIEFRNQPELFLRLENKYIEIILKMFSNVIEKYNTYKDGVLDHTIKAYIWNLLCVVKEILLSGEVRRLTLETPNKVFLQSKFTVAKMIIIFLKKSQFNKIFFLRSVYSIAIASVYSLLRTGRKPYNQQVVVKGILDPVNYNFNLNDINMLVYEISENEEENDKSSVFGAGTEEIPKPVQETSEQQQQQSIELDKEFLRELPAEMQGALKKDFLQGDMDIETKLTETIQAVPNPPSTSDPNLVNVPNDFLKVLPAQQLSQVLNKVFEKKKAEENKFDHNNFLQQLDNGTRSEVLNCVSEKVIKN